MHKDYAIEYLNRMRHDREISDNYTQESADLLTIRSFVYEKELQALVKKVGSDKSKNIVEAIEKNTSNKYFNVTNKMEWSIANDLLNLFSAEEIIEKMFEIKEAEENNQAEKSKKIIQKMIEKNGLEKVKISLIDAIYKEDLVNKAINGEYTLNEQQINQFLIYS